MIFLCLASCANPGYVKKNRDHAETIEDLKSCDSDQICYECLSYKPNRSHHCDICKKCVYVWDHHCAWINNCVGSFNHSHFITFLILASILFLSTITMSVLIGLGITVNPKIWFLYDQEMEYVCVYVLVILGIFTLLNMFLFFQIFILLITQMRFLSLGITTIEAQISKNPSMQNSIDSRVNINPQT